MIRQAARALVTAVAIAWASPWTLLGLTLGLSGLLSGGGLQRRGRTLEFWGGAVDVFLRRCPMLCEAAAMTLGHVVLGRTRADLDACRGHEEVHVRQYERWGPLFVPAYLACSVWLWATRRDAYLDNPFEVAARRDAREEGCG